MQGWATASLRHAYQILARLTKMVGTALARACPPSTSSRTFPFQRDIQLGAVRVDLALGVQLQSELDDLGHAKVAQGFSRPVDGRGRRLFPGILAGTDQLNNLVDALGHVVLRWFQAGLRCSCRGLSLTSPYRA